MNGKQLKNSLLQWAIQGRLVDQDPNDEPASSLLKRIRTEKEKLVKEGKLKKANLNDSIIYKADDNKYYEKTGKETKCIDDQIPFEIPSSWEWCRLGNVFSIIMGQSPNGNSVYENKEGTEFHQGKIYFQDKYLAQSNQITTEPSKIAPANSILLCVRAPVGKVNITKRTICIGRGLCAIVPMCNMTEDFCFYLLSALENVFIRSATGTTFLAITGEVVKNLLLPLPPLSEQGRIVGKLEELLSVVERYEKAQDELDSLCNSLNGRLRKSILQEAIQGHLVPQDPNDVPASSLLKRIKEEKERLVKEGKLKKANLNDSIIYKADDNKYYEKKGKETKCIDDQIPFEIPSSWEWVRLLNVSYSVGNKKNQIKTSEIKSFGKYAVVSQGKQLIDGFCDEEIKSINDLPIVMFGDHTRNVKYIDFPFVIGADGTKFIKGILIDQKYFFYLLKFLSVSLRDRGYARHYSLLCSKLLPLPPLSEQGRIVGKLEELFGVLDRLSGK